MLVAELPIATPTSGATLLDHGPIMGFASEEAARPWDTIVIGGCAYRAVAAWWSDGSHYKAHVWLKGAWYSYDDYTGPHAGKVVLQHGGFQPDGNFIGMVAFARVK